MSENEISLHIRMLFGRITALLSLLVALFAFTMAQAHGSDDCGFAVGTGKRNGSREFLIFDATLYRNKPDLSSLGIKPIRVIDRGIWPPAGDTASTPDKDLVKALAQKLPKDGIPVVLDFEQWPLNGNVEVVSASISKLIAVVAMFKKYAPETPFGFYGVLPIRDYWRAIEGESKPKYLEWQAENDRLAPIEREVDALFPSLYTFYDDQDGWRKYAKAQICEARRISRKPIFAFLWPEYHDSNSKLKGTYIDARFWRIQLEAIRNFADGVVIWGGYDLVRNGPRDWDENAPWWQQTKRFAIQLKSSHATP